MCNRKQNRRWQTKQDPKRTWRLSQIHFAVHLLNFLEHYKIHSLTARSSVGRRLALFQTEFQLRDIRKQHWAPAFLSTLICSMVELSESWTRAQHKHRLNVRLRSAAVSRTAWLHWHASVSEVALSSIDITLRTLACCRMAKSKLDVVKPQREATGA
ncbi:hypothetical protein PHSY_000235 [Pseudozyma hubeiensis SY62]|uniref:Uncharacterized protein n=1 Tax=Pseudozyma hubeiensis (strain SY62) TaxID=1305764 RepID=R9P3J7_PSEHS|nr:hypothetical protein PHSY_000235 [Pseudozyma hubeiensis SY62]GAC92680.1 hypothetical protein PHSY_000235 [Pseudozyma hubeiensis SY62]